MNDPGIMAAALIGLLVVAGFVYLVTAIGRLRRSVEELRESVRAAPRPGLRIAAEATNPQPAGEEAAEETVAAIAAAASTLLGNDVRVRQIRQVSNGSSAWAQQGRASVQGSHNLTRG